MRYLKKVDDKSLQILDEYLSKFIQVNALLQLLSHQLGKKYSIIITCQST